MNYYLRLTMNDVYKLDPSWALCLLKQTSPCNFGHGNYFPALQNTTSLILQGRSNTWFKTTVASGGNARAVISRFAVLSRIWDFAFCFWRTRRSVPLCSMEIGNVHARAQLRLGHERKPIPESACLIQNWSTFGILDWRAIDSRSLCIREMQFHPFSIYSHLLDILNFVSQMRKFHLIHLPK